MSDEPNSDELPVGPDGSADTETIEDAATPVPGALELVSLGEGQTVGDLARLLLDIAETLGLHPHTVDYQPRAGGFMVPLEVAAAYAETVADVDDFGPVDAPKGARQVRKATVKKAAPAKRAAKKAAKPAKEEGGQGD